jgi:aromatic-L-amino-acid decarboxylase
VSGAPDHYAPPVTSPAPMSPDEFRRAGHAMIDWIADYWGGLAADASAGAQPKFPVLSRASPGDLLAQLPAGAPESGEAWDAIAADVDRLIMPGITHWQSPHFYAYFPASASFPGVLGELLSAGLGVNGMLWATSPAATELELRVVDWVARLLGLPDKFLNGAAGGSRRSGPPDARDVPSCIEPSPRDRALRQAAPAGAGAIQGTASESALIAMLAARARALWADPAPDPDSLTLYTSTQAHSSIIKAAMIAGLARSPDDRRRVRLIGTDAAYAMDPATLRDAIASDLAAGLRPFYICATVGTTSSTAIDPVRAIGEIAHRHTIWLHVDAAHAGAAAICPEFRHLLDGVDLADSLCFNPHKWLLTNFDCDLFWTSDRASLERALSITPEYLRTTASPGGTGVPPVTSGGTGVPPVSAAPAEPDPPPSAGTGATSVPPFDPVDLRDWQVPLGRRFRALKLWFVLRRYGAANLRAHVREHVRLAALFESWVRADARFELLAPRTLNLVCFRLKGPSGGDGPTTDMVNRNLLNRLNASGKIYLTHTVLPRRPHGPDGPPPSAFTLRFCVGSAATREEHVRAAWELIRAAAAG